MLRQSKGTLSVQGQPFGSVGHEVLPVSFPVLPWGPQMVPVFAGVLLPQGVSELPLASAVRPVP